MSFQLASLNGVFDAREFAVAYPALNPVSIVPANPARYSIAFASDDLLLPTFVTTLNDGSGGGIIIANQGYTLFKASDFPAFVGAEWWLLPKAAIGTIRVIECWQIPRGDHVHARYLDRQESGDQDASADRR